MLLNKLRPNDKVAIVTYAGRSAVVLEPTEAIEKKTILNAIDNLNSGGGTAGAEGIKTAYELAELHFMEKGNNRVILATDGDFNIGISSSKELEQMIEKKRNKGIYLSVLGYGMGNYMDDKMQTLADKGNGNHAYIDNIQEARKVLISEFGGTLYTVAKDVKIQIEFNPAYVQSYRLVGYENRMLNKEDFNNDRKDAGEVGAGHCVTAIYEIIPVGSSSRFGPKVDALKYQENRQKISGKENGELAHIKCRYKLPREESSIKFENIVKHDLISEKLLDDDIRFAIAVAEFGLILSESQYLESSDLTACINRAQKSKSDDKEGYRSEFVRLVKTVNDLK
jgi:Ca-activated chloride channel family protein